MSESTPTTSSSTERCKGTVIVRPIVYGNTAVYLGKKREEDGHTHQWTCYLRPYNNEDISKWVRKVQFKLHDSYANSLRVVEKPPFEVTETGWGEFEVQMRIYFTDANEKPITAFHYIRLFQPQFTLPNGKTRVVAEYYDEIIFQDPTLPLFKSLKNAEASMKKYDTKRFTTDFNQTKKRTYDGYMRAKEQLNAEINDLRDSLKDAHQLMMKYKAEVGPNPNDYDSSGPSTPAVAFSL